MKDFSPKSQFQIYHKAEAELLQQQTGERWFNISMEAAFAQLGCHGASSDEMKGARALIQVLLNLTETSTVERLPIKSLEVLGREPVPPAPKPQEKK